MLKLFVVLAFAAMLFAGTSFAHDAMKEKGGDGKVTIIIKHEVKDYAAWRKVYDADLPNRKGHHFMVMGVFTDVKNPNMVTIIGHFPSAEAANEFITNPKLKEAMEKAGVIGAPDITLLHQTPGK